MARDCGGGQNFQNPDAKHEGLERVVYAAVVGLVRQAIGCPAQWKYHACPNMKGYLEGTSGTPNHRIGLRLWRYGCAQRDGDQEELTDARLHLNDFLERQFTTEGLQWGETLTTNHDWLWLIAFTAARILGRHYHDDELTELAGRSLAGCLGHWRALDWHSHVISPCSRGTLPYSDLRSVAYAMLDPHPFPNKIKNPRKAIVTKRFWRDTYNVGAWQLRWLLNDGDDLVGCATNEPLRNSVVIQRAGDDMVAGFPYLTKASDALWWASVLAGTVATSNWDRGDINNQDSPEPAPRLEGAVVDVIAGLQDPGSSSSPER